MKKLSAIMVARSTLQVFIQAFMVLEDELLVIPQTPALSQLRLKYNMESGARPELSEGRDPQALPRSREPWGA